MYNYLLSVERKSLTEYSKLCRRKLIQFQDHCVCTEPDTINIGFNSASEGYNQCHITDIRYSSTATLSCKMYQAY